MFRKPLSAPGDNLSIRKYESAVLEGFSWLQRLSLLFWIMFIAEQKRSDQKLWDTNAALILYLFPTHRCGFCCIFGLFVAFGCLLSEEEKVGEDGGESF